MDGFNAISNQPRYDDSKKLFVGGLSFNTSDEDLKNYFMNFGNVIDASVKFDPVSGRPRGFGFVIYNDTASIEKVLSQREHTINGKTVEPKKAEARPASRKIFVGGLPATVESDMVKKHFSQYGVVDDVERPSDRSSGTRKNFCFVLFHDETGVEAACGIDKHTIEGAPCDVRKVVPPLQRPNKMGRGGFRGRGDRGGFVGGERGGFRGRGARPSPYSYPPNPQSNYGQTPGYDYTVYQMNPSHPGYGAPPGPPQNYDQAGYPPANPGAGGAYDAGFPYGTNTHIGGNDPNWANATAGTTQQQQSADPYGGSGTYGGNW